MWALASWLITTIICDIMLINCGLKLINATILAVVINRRRCLLRRTTSGALLLLELILALILVLIGSILNHSY